MGKTLGGSLFIRQGIEYDYCFKEAIECLCEFCDKVSVVDAGSFDGTTQILMELELKHPHLSVTYLSKEHWDSQHGKEKLSYFSNMAIAKLDTDYNFSLQADEILHENSYDAVRKAIETGSEGYLVSRINLWGSPYTKLNVAHNRKPCSTEITRLAKPRYLHYDDAESIAVIPTDAFLDQIRIYHFGFVRSRDVHVKKIEQMQRDIFLTTPDVKLDGMKQFDPWKWFDKSDVAPIAEPLPAIIQQWASERFYTEND